MRQQKGLTMPITFICPRCKEELEAPDSTAGQHMNCPACTGLITVPPSAPPAPAPRPARTIAQPATTHSAQPSTLSITSLRPPFRDVLDVTFKVVVALIVVGLLPILLFGIIIPSCAKALSP